MIRSSDSSGQQGPASAARRSGSIGGGEHGLQWPSREELSHRRNSSGSSFSSFECISARGGTRPSRHSHPVSAVPAGHGDYYRPRLQTNVRAAVLQGCYSDACLESAMRGRRGGAPAARSVAVGHSSPTTSVNLAARAGADDDDSSVCSHASGASALSALGALGAATERMTIKPFQDSLQRMRQQRHSAPQNLSMLGSGFGSSNNGSSFSSSISNRNAEWGTLSQGTDHSTGRPSNAAGSLVGFGLLRRGSAPPVQQQRQISVANPFLQETTNLRDLLSNSCKDSFREATTRSQERDQNEESEEDEGEELEVFWAGESR